MARIRSRYKAAAALTTCLALRLLVELDRQWSASFSVPRSVPGSGRGRAPADAWGAPRTTTSPSCPRAQVARQAWPGSAWWWSGTDPLSMAVRQFLHLNRWLRMGAEHWFGPVNFDRANFRISGMDTYAVVASIFLQIMIGMHSGMEKPEESAPRWQKIMFNFMMVALAISILCSTYSMAVFLLSKIYSCAAIGYYRDVAYDSFRILTFQQRRRAFRSLLVSMDTFLIVYALDLFMRMRSKAGAAVTILVMVGCGYIVYEWMKLMHLASQSIFATWLLS